MSRRKAAPKRKILPDPKYGNLKLAKFMNQIMKTARNPLQKVLFMELYQRLKANLKKNL